MKIEELIEGAYAHGIVQIREEITRLVNLIAQRPLRNILEIGTHSGGTFYLWCKLATGKKIAIDLPDGNSGSHRYVDAQARAERDQMLHNWAPQVHIISGNSHDEKIAEHVGALLNRGTPFPDSVDLLFIDGDHSAKGVEQDYEMYSHLVRPGGLLIFHDIKDTEYHRRHGCFVANFWKELKETEQTIEIIGEGEWGGLGVVIV